MQSWLGQRGSRRGKRQNEILHSKFEPGDSIFRRLGKRSFFSPMIVLNPITGDDCASPITPVPTMDKDRLRKRFNQRKQSPHFLLARASEAMHRNIRI